MNDASSQPPLATPRAHVVLVGAGNIGSAMAGELARMPVVGCVTVVDPDVYETKNLAAQQIEPSDVGRAKAVVQAERISRLSPSTVTTAIVDRVENVPPGRLRADAIVACVDSKAARRDVNSLAHHLGVPWFDSGVDAAAGLLARVNVYLPGPGSPCHECGWDDGAYETLEAKHACTSDVATSPTNAPAYLGSLAAAVQAAELSKLLNGEREFLAAGKSIVISARYYTLDVTRLVRNPACRFDHEIWRTELLDHRSGKLTFGQVLDPAGALLAVEGRPFVRVAQCDRCMRRGDVRTFALSPEAGAMSPCDCGGRLFPLGCETVDELAPGDLEALRDVPLARAGIGEGDVLRLTGPDGEILRREIACDRPCNHWRKQ